MAAIIFDFDGTLADTQRGILATAQEVLRRMGREPADEQALAATIGLPLKENFTRGAGLSGKHFCQINPVVVLFQVLKGF